MSVEAARRLRRLVRVSASFGVILLALAIVTGVYVFFFLYGSSNNIGRDPIFEAATLLAVVSTAGLSGFMFGVGTSNLWLVRWAERARNVRRQ